VIADGREVLDPLVEIDIEGQYWRQR